MLKHIICRKCYIKLGRGITEAKIEVAGNEITMLFLKKTYMVSVITF